MHNTFNSNVTNLGLNGNRVESGSFLGRLSQVDGKVEDVSVRSVIFYMESNLYPFKLCYKFGNEPFKLYQRHTVYVKFVVGMSQILEAQMLQLQMLQCRSCGVLLDTGCKKQI